MPDLDKSYQELIITNFGLSPSGYTGSRGDVGYVGSAGAGATIPTIASIGYIGNNTATDVAGGETITLTGTGFVTGCSVIINGSPVGAVTFISSTQITFITPALSAGTYILYVVNSDGSTAISVPGISYSGVPSFYTAAGSVGTVYEANSFNSNVAAVGDSAITYSIASGLLPTGATLNANGVITGTSVLTGNTTTYTFGVNASDGQNQDVTRTYTITVNPDLVTWSSPANGATISLNQGSSTSTTLTAASAAGSAITYTANALPTGLSIVGSAVTGTPTVLGNTTSILTANAASTTRTATITVTWNISVSGEPYFAYNSLLLSGNGTNNAQNNTFLDSSTNNFTITRNGNTTQGTFSPYGANWSNSFTASSGDYLSVPYSSGFNLPGDFTVECWFNPSLLPTSAGVGTPLYPRIFSFGTYNAANSLGLEINSDGLSSKAIGVWYNGNVSFSANNIVTVSQWYHCAVVRSGTTITVYLNGTSVITINSASAAVNTTQAFLIGSLQGFTTSAEACFKGYISNLRVVKGTAVYTSAFTPSTTPLTAISGTTLLTCQSNRFIDNSSTAATITSFGTAGIQRFSPFSPGVAYSASTVGGSAYFDGAGDYLTAPSGSGSLGTGNFTVEGWIYCTANSPQYPTIFSNYSGAGGTAFAIFSSYNNNRITLYVGGSTAVAASATITFNTWIHVAAVRNSGVVTLYINGVSQGTVSYSGSSSGDGIARIGCAGDAPTTTNFQGYTSNVRWVIGTAVYTSNFTPPTAPLTAVTNTSLLCNFTNAGIIDGTMINNIETIGDAKISTAQSKFGSSSIYFDGTGDYLTIPTSPNLQFGTGDFTIELWTYFTARGTQGSTFIGNYNAYTAGSLAIFAGHGSGNTAKYQVSYNGSGFPSIQSSTSIIYNQWAHIALVRNGTTITLYINGVADGTITGASAALNGVGSSWFVGTAGDAIANYYVTGYIDDLRITKGYARYTANFTPPSTALSTQ